MSSRWWVLLPWLKALASSYRGMLLLVGGGSHKAMNVLCEKNFGWMMSGGWIQEGWDLISWRALRLEGGGGSLWVMVSAYGEAGRTPFKNFPEISLTTQEKHGKPRSGKPNRVRHWSLYRLGRLIGDILDWPAEHRSSSVHRELLQTAFRRNHLTLSRNSVSALMWSTKNMTPKFSWITLLPTYIGALIAMWRQFRTWLRAADIQNPSYDGQAV
jgi:hypothetical protein